jgi:hypothetical protein
MDRNFQDYWDLPHRIPVKNSHLSGVTINVVLKTASHPTLALLKLERNRNQTWYTSAWKRDVNLRPECIQKASKAESGDEHQEHKLGDHGPQR